MRLNMVYLHCKVNKELTTHGGLNYYELQIN